MEGGVVIDTGAAAHALDFDARGKIEHLLLSHAHLDHTLGIPFLLGDAHPIVYGLKQTLDVVRSHLLDGHIWPDLSDLASWQAVQVGHTFKVGPWDVEVGPANHTVPCVSYFFRGDGFSLAIVGDTRHDDTVVRWVADRAPDACVIEVSYPDRIAAMARRFGHQTPADAARWRRWLGPACALCISHLKPDHHAEISAECEALKDPNLRILSDGDVIH